MKTGKLRVRKLSSWKTAGAVFLVCAATAIASPAQTFATLVNFDGTDGANPEAGWFRPLTETFTGQLTTAGPTGKERSSKLP